MSNPSTHYLNHVDSLLADPLHVARAAASTGSKVVGYIGDEIPVSLIVASGALPLRLRGRAGRATPRADEFMESAFTPSVREIAERWRAGDLDFLDAVVFPRADDSAQRLYYYLCELQRRGRCAGPRALLLDIAKIARGTSVAHSRGSVQRLAQELGVKSDQLAAAWQRVARRKALIAGIRAGCQDAAPLAGALAWKVREAAEYDWRTSHDETTSQWLRLAPALTNVHRIVLAGNAPPDDSIHRAVEASQGSVVLELTGAASGDETDAAGDLDAIADHFQARINTVQAMRRDADWVVSRARDVHADAVVLWLIEEDEALPWEIARQMRSLRDAGMPALLLTRQPWAVDDSALRQVTEFMTALKVER